MGITHLVAHALRARPPDKPIVMLPPGENA
jgi:hypothetical protein